MEEAGMIQRLFKMSEIAQFDHKQGKKNLFYETDQTAGAVWCLEPGQEIPTMRMLRQMIYGFAFKERELFIQRKGKKLKLR